VHGAIATPSRAYVHYCSELPNDSFACCQRQAVRPRPIIMVRNEAGEIVYQFPSN
jgi:hypothetical protein